VFIDTLRILFAFSAETKTVVTHCGRKRGSRDWCYAPSCPRLSLSVSLGLVHVRRRGVRRPCTCSICRAATCSRFLTDPAPAVDPYSANEKREVSVAASSWPRAEEIVRAMVYFSARGV
jgi:hypothetical protein